MMLDCRIVANRVHYATFLSSILYRVNGVVLAVQVLYTVLVASRQSKWKTKLSDSKAKKKDASRKPASSKVSASPASAPSAPAKGWTFLTNHTHVLALLHSNPQLVLRQVAIEVGITERAVQRIVQDLEEGGFIRREKVGRNNRYEVLTDERLRHPIESHRKIGDLLKLIQK